MSNVWTYKFESGENNFDGNSMHRCLDVIELEKTLSSFIKMTVFKKFSIAILAKHAAKPKSKMIFQTYYNIISKGCLKKQAERLKSRERSPDGS